MSASSGYHFTCKRVLLGNQSGLHRLYYATLGRRDVLLVEFHVGLFVDFFAFLSNIGHIFTQTPHHIFQAGTHIYVRKCV